VANFIVWFVMQGIVFFAIMVFIPGGTFFMGADNVDAKFPGADPGIRSMLKAEEPRSQITIRSFYIDKTEVTNEQFLRFVRSHPEYASKLWAGGPDHPVAFVTWFQANAYCSWQGKRLPSEAEWEFAARGGNREAEYSWGSEPPTPSRANFSDSKVSAPVRVGLYPPNGYGIHDMAGNVWEFTSDNWRDRHDSTPSEGPGARKVIRGGSFGAAALQLRVTFRDSHKPDDPVAHVGFRCARDQ
jgi:formylglycine-generating enzyme required for sulfatase activity